MSPTAPSPTTTNTPPSRTPAASAAYQPVPSTSEVARRLGMQIVRRQLRRRYQRTVREGHARGGACAPRHELSLLAGRLEAEAAVRTGIVGDTERADDELTRSDRWHLAADLHDDAAIFMPHRHRRRDVVQAAEGPKIGSADAGRRQPDDRVSRIDVSSRSGTSSQRTCTGSIENSSQTSEYLPSIGLAASNAPRDQKKGRICVRAAQNHGSCR